MGNCIFSCCHPCRRARNDSRNQTPRDIARCSSDSFNELLSINISDPLDLQKLSEQLEKINLEILKEQRIKEGAEKIRRVVTDKKHLADVEDFLEKSKRKLQHLYSTRQEIHGYIEIHGQKHLSDEPEESKTSVHGATSLPPAVENGYNEQSPSANLDVDKEAPSFSDDEPYLTARSRTPSTSLTSSSGEPLSEDSDSYFTASSTSVKGIEEMSRELSVGSQPESPLSMEHFRCCAVLGRGSFGKVLLAEHIKSRKMVAIKTLKKIEIVEEENVSRLLCEKSILQTASSARHPFVVNLFACFQSKDRIFFTMEYASGGDLKTLLNNRREGRFPEYLAEFYAACIVLGVEFLHGNNIAHRDLKLANIVIDHHGFAKITDFGASKAGMGLHDRTRSFCGTLPYMAPEIIKRRSYTRVVDWWSVGIMIYEMLVGRRPFVGKSLQHLANLITDSGIVYPHFLSYEAIVLMRALLEKIPALRLGAKENDVALVKQQPFFVVFINWNRLRHRQALPPYIPPISGAEDISNFNSAFTSADPVLTLPTGLDIRPEQQEAFEGFEWISEGAL